MTARASFLPIVNALGIPLNARVDSRVPKKLLIEQCASTVADKRAIQDGIDEMQWFAACKPATIGVPAFFDDTRNYLEIAIVGCSFRPRAKISRLIELIHRAIPYPVLLVTADVNGLAISVAHKRHAQNEVGRTVIDQIIMVSDLQAESVDSVQDAFLKNLALVQQSRTDLFVLYSSWIAQIEAANAARVTGIFAPTDNQEAITRRHKALDAHARLTKEIQGLRTKTMREKHLSRRVYLNIEIQRRIADLTVYTNQL